jgi:hypothetical protein
MGARKWFVPAGVFAVGFGLGAMTPAWRAPRPPGGAGNYASYRAEVYASLPEVPAGGTVFLGDSLVEYGAWHERWPGGIARGVAGARVRDVRLCVPELGRHRPRAVVVMCGVNDLQAKADVEAEYAALVKALRDETPARVRVCSILPVGEAWRGDPAGLNVRVRQANITLAGLADGGRVEYLDLWPTMTDGRGRLRAELTADGLHLNAAGYAAWAAALRATN